MSISLHVFMQKWEFFHLFISRTDLKCSIQKAHGGRCLQCWRGVLITLYTWVFCIALPYKMCLEIVVIHSSRNTIGYTIVLWNSRDERELNRLLYLHCLVLWKQSQYFNNQKECLHLPWWNQWRRLCYSIDASCPKLLAGVTIWDRCEYVSEVCKVIWCIVFYMSWYFPVNWALFSNLRFWFFKTVGQHFMTRSDPRIFKLKKTSICHRCYIKSFDYFLLDGITFLNSEES